MVVWFLGDEFGLAGLSAGGVKLWVMCVNF